jgi:hypothetical protein
MLDKIVPVPILYRPKEDPAASVDASLTQAYPSQGEHTSDPTTEPKIASKEAGYANTSYFMRQRFPPPVRCQNTETEDGSASPPPTLFARPDELPSLVSTTTITDAAGKTITQAGKLIFKGGTLVVEPVKARAGAEVAREQPRRRNPIVSAVPPDDHLHSCSRPPSRFALSKEEAAVIIGRLSATLQEALRIGLDELSD